MQMECPLRANASRTACSNGDRCARAEIVVAEARMSFRGQEQTLRNQPAAVVRTSMPARRARCCPSAIRDKGRRRCRYNPCDQNDRTDIQPGPGGFA